MLKILKDPNPLLRKKTESIKLIDSSILNLIEDMLKTCRISKGVGLAAPQVGFSIRLCVIDLEYLGLKPFPLINPKIVKKSWKKKEMEEGCLSVPGVFGLVKRPEKIRILAENTKGEKFVFAANGLLARVIQHEIDHLEGILFVEKMIKRTLGNKNDRIQI